MINLASKIANEAKAGDIIGLVGTLGVGKSFFAKSFKSKIYNFCCKIKKVIIYRKSKKNIGLNFGEHIMLRLEK